MYTLFAEIKMVKKGTWTFLRIFIVHLPPSVTCHVRSCHMPRVTCHMSCVMCHMSHVTCHMCLSLLVELVGGACWGMVCYQWGLPRLVTMNFVWKTSHGHAATLSRHLSMSNWRDKNRHICNCLQLSAFFFFFKSLKSGHNSCIGLWIKIGLQILL